MAQRWEEEIQGNKRAVALGLPGKQTLRRAANLPFVIPSGVEGPAVQRISGDEVFGDYHDLRLAHEPGRPFRAKVQGSAFPSVLCESYKGRSTLSGVLVLRKECKQTTRRHGIVKVNGKSNHTLECCYRNVNLRTQNDRVARPGESRDGFKHFITKSAELRIPPLRYAAVPRQAGAGGMPVPRWCRASARRAFLSSLPVATLRTRTSGLHGNAEQVGRHRDRWFPTPNNHSIGMRRLTMTNQSRLPSRPSAEENAASTERTQMNFSNGQTRTDDSSALCLCLPDMRIGVLQ
jgi:hypothetical protein